MTTIYPTGGFCDPQFKKIEEIFNQAIESGHEVGASLAIEHKGKLVVSLFGGHKDQERTSSWEKDTWVNVFSVTKAVTATCIARLIEEGKLDVSKPVSFYWPEYGCNGKENTKVSDFLCHRAGAFGFQDGVPNIKWTNWHGFIKALEVQKPFREPGSSQGYHALTYGWLVGELIRRVDGRTAGKYFKEEIAEPFGIDFKIGLDEEDFDNCADTLMLENSGIGSNSLGLFKYIPDFFLPRGLKNFKKALIGGDFTVAFESLENENMGDVNSPDWRMSEIPSANGHGSAESLAKLYGNLILSGKDKERSILKPETLKEVTKVYSSEPDSVLMGGDMSFGLGYMLHNKLSKFETSRKYYEGYFGHSGIGGAVAFGDVEKEIGFGFICNKQHKLNELYKTSNELSKALISII